MLHVILDDRVAELAPNEALGIENRVLKCAQEAATNELLHLVIQTLQLWYMCLIP